MAAQQGGDVLTGVLPADNHAAFTEMLFYYERFLVRSQELNDVLNIDTNGSGPDVDFSPLPLMQLALTATLSAVTGRVDDLGQVQEATGRFKQSFFQLCKIELITQTSFFEDFETKYKPLQLSLTIPVFMDIQSIASTVKNFLDSIERGTESAHIEVADTHVIKMRSAIRKLKEHVPDLEQRLQEKDAAARREMETDRMSTRNYWLAIIGLIVGVAGITLAVWQWQSQKPAGSRFFGEATRQSHPALQAPLS